MFRRIIYFLGLNFALLITFSLILAFVPLPKGYYLQSLVIYGIFGFGGALFSLLMSRKMAKWSMRVQVIDPQNPQNATEDWLVKTVHQYAKLAKLPAMPEVGLYESSQLNAFATGPTKSRSLVAVSTGLMNAMGQDEIEGVLGHEVSHIKNGDMVTMVLLQGTINTLVMFAARILSDIAASALSRDERGGWGLRYILYIVFSTLLGFLGMIITGTFSRQREFRADHGSARIAGREKMIKSLERLQMYYNPKQKTRKQEEAIAALQISGSFTSGFKQLMSTHPPLEKRIEALKKLRL